MTLLAGKRVRTVNRTGRQRAGKWQQTGSVNQSVCHAVCVYGCREPQSDARATDVLYALEMLHDLKAQFV